LADSFWPKRVDITDEDDISTSTVPGRKSAVGHHANILKDVKLPATLSEARVYYKEQVCNKDYGKCRLKL
jgi:hypothetical protein